MRNYIKISFGIGALLGLLFTLLWVYSHAFISVTVSGPSNAPLSYVLINQADGRRSDGVLDKGTFKKLLRTGSYELHVTGSENSYITTLKSGRFLSTTTINGSTSREKKRDFLGYNPAPCMRVLSGILYSYECIDKISNAVIHVPATDALPTYTVKNGLGNEAVIQDINYTKLGTLLLTGPLYDSDEGDLLSAPVVGVIGSDLSIKVPFSIPDIYPGALTSITPYEEGFLLHAEDLRKTYYYSSLGSPATLIEFPGPSQGATRGKITSDGEVLIGYYASDEVADDEEDQITDQIPTDIYVEKNGTVDSYEIDQTVLNAVPCEGYICVLTSNRRLTVYRIGAKTLEEVMVLTDINELYSNSGKIEAVNQTGVLTLDPEEKTGSYLYTFGEYVYCGIQPAPAGFVLCLIDGSQNKVAAYVANDEPVTFALDKRVVQLQKNPRIDTVSAYRNRVFISPVLTTRAVVQGGTLENREILKGQNLLRTLLPELGLGPNNSNGITVVNTTAP